MEQTKSIQLPTNDIELSKLFKRKFETMRDQYKRLYKLDKFSTPQHLPKKDITEAHIYNLIHYCYSDDTISLQLKDVLKFEEIQPSATIERKEKKQALESKENSALIRLKTEIQRLKEERRIQIQRDNEAEEKRAQELTDIENQHAQELQKKYVGLVEHEKILSDTENRHSKEIQEQSEQITQLLTDIDTIQKSKSGFVGFLKSDMITVIGLLAVIFYQGYHSQQFFADRAQHGDDFKNMLFSCVSSFAISLTGFKLTLHTKNIYWIWGAACIDFMIYITPKEMSFANILAAFAVASSIVAYSHILQAKK